MPIHRHCTPKLMTHDDSHSELIEESQSDARRVMFSAGWMGRRQDSPPSESPHRPRYECSGSEETNRQPSIVPKPRHFLINKNCTSNQYLVNPPNTTNCTRHQKQKVYPDRITISSHATTSNIKQMKQQACNCDLHEAFSMYGTHTHYIRNHFIVPRYLTGMAIGPLGKSPRMFPFRRENIATVCVLWYDSGTSQQLVHMGRRKGSHNGVTQDESEEKETHF